MIFHLRGLSRGRNASSLPAHCSAFSEVPSSLSTSRKKCLPTPSVPSCTFASLLFFPPHPKTILVSVTRASPRRCSYFQARKNPGRCFISDRISHRNFERVTARTRSRLPSLIHLSSCPPMYRVFRSLRHARSSPPPSPRTTLLFAKCLRTVAAVVFRQLQTLRTFHPWRCRQVYPYRTPFSTETGDISTSAPFISSPLGRISRVTRDFRYFLRIVSYSDGWAVTRAVVSRSRSLYVLWISADPRSPRQGMHLICRDYTNALWAITRTNGRWRVVMDLLRRALFMTVPSMAFRGRGLWRVQLVQRNIGHDNLSVREGQRTI